MSDSEKHGKGWRATCAHGCSSRSEHHRRITYENLNKPSHPPTNVVDDDDLAPAAADKGAIGNPYAPRNYNEDRVSEPLRPGAASGDHGVGAGRNQELAAHFLDLRQSTTAWTPLAMLRSQNGDNQNYDRDITHPTGHVHVGRLDAAAAAGASGPLLPSGNPAVHGPDHSAPIGASNGVHTLGERRDPVSHAAPMAAKSRFEIMREAMYGPR